MLRCYEWLWCVLWFFRNVTPQSKLSFSVVHHHRTKADAVMATGKVDLLPLLQQHGGKCKPPFTLWVGSPTPRGWAPPSHG